MFVLSDLFIDITHITLNEEAGRMCDMTHLFVHKYTTTLFWDLNANNVPKIDMTQFLPKQTLHKTILNLVCKRRSQNRHYTNHHSEWVNEEARRVLESTSNQSNTPVKGHSTHTQRYVCVVGHDFFLAPLVCCGTCFFFFFVAAYVFLSPHMFFSRHHLGDVGYVLSCIFFFFHMWCWICVVMHISPLAPRMAAMLAIHSWQRHRCCLTPHLYVWYKLFVYVISYMWYDAVICVPGLTHMRDMTHSYVRDMTHLYAWYDSSMCVAWLIDTRDMTPSCSWQDLFIRVTWLIHMCVMTESYAWHGSFICMPWLAHMRDMTHSCVRHDSFMCMNWLT